MNFSFD